MINNHVPAVWVEVDAEMASAPEPTPTQQGGGDVGGAPDALDNYHGQGGSYVIDGDTQTRQPNK